MRALFLCLLSFGLLACAACDEPADPASSSSAVREPLDVVTAGGRHRFEVEVVSTPPERERGLMFRRHMAENHGMLFDFGREREVSMWMKNTYLPLDMLFIKADGTIVTIAENTRPHSLKAIPSRRPVRAVLEINAGTVARLGIAPGDRVAHPLFPAPD